jgi:hypothetical protein
MRGSVALVTGIILLVILAVWQWLLRSAPVPHVGPYAGTFATVNIVAVVIVGLLGLFMIYRGLTTTRA